MMATWLEIASTVRSAVAESVRGRYRTPPCPRRARSVLRASPPGGARKSVCPPTAPAAPTPRRGGRSESGEAEAIGATGREARGAWISKLDLEKAEGGAVAGPKAHGGRKTKQV